MYMYLLDSVRVVDHYEYHNGVISVKTNFLLHIMLIPDMPRYSILIVYFNIGTILSS